METQKAFYESQLELLRASHQIQIENLENEVNDNYNEGLMHSYQCIMAVLERQHPNLKMDELTASVIDYMNEEAAKKDVEETGPNAIEKVTSPPPLTPINVAEASTLPGAISETPFASLPDNPAEATLLTDPLSM